MQPSIRERHKRRLASLTTPCTSPNSIMCAKPVGWSDHSTSLHDSTCHCSRFVLLRDSCGMHAFRMTLYPPHSTMRMSAKTANIMQAIRRTSAPSWILSLPSARLSPWVVTSAVAARAVLGTGKTTTIHYRTSLRPPEKQGLGDYRNLVFLVQVLIAVSESNDPSRC